MIISAIIISLFQWAPPPPIVLRDHAPPQRLEDVVSADCGSYQAQVRREWLDHHERLEVYVDDRYLSSDDIATIRDNTPVLDRHAAVSMLCHPDSLLIIVKHDADEFAIMFEGEALETLMHNNRTIWRSSPLPRLD